MLQSGEKGERRQVLRRVAAESVPTANTRFVQWVVVRCDA